MSNIGNRGAGPVCRGISSKKVSGEYILEYGTDHGVRRQVVECACMMGPCQRRLS